VSCDGRSCVSQKYHKDDLKGKGEPGFTQDKIEKEQKAARRQRSRSESHAAYELVPQSEFGKSPRVSNHGPFYSESEFQSNSGSLGRSKSTASRAPRGSLGSKLKNKLHWIKKD
jgi:hypothetical protein